MTLPTHAQLPGAPIPQAAFTPPRLNLPLPLHVNTALPCLCFQVIFGRGNASIGLHFDKDNACAGGSRTPVSTYLAICEGSKLVLLLPPDQTLLPAGGDPDLLLNPTPQLLADVKAAGPAMCHTLGE